MWTVQGVIVSLVVGAAQVFWWFVDDAPDRATHYVVAAAWLVLATAYIAVRYL